LGDRVQQDLGEAESAFGIISHREEIERIEERTASLSGSSFDGQRWLFEFKGKEPSLSGASGTYESPIQGKTEARGGAGAPL
jgi:hypothetical protein